MKKVYNFTNNEFTTKSEKYIDVVSPITADVIAQVADSSTEDVKSVIENAAAAQKEWGALTFKQRAQYMFTYRELLIRDKDELAEIIHMENGKTINEAMAEVNKAIELTEFASSIPSVISGKTQMVSGGIEVKELRQPKGVIASICPFNFPLMVPHWTIPNVITCGNSIVVKASEKTPLTMVKVASLLKEAGIPDGVFNVVNGGVDCVNELCENELIETVTFVGSSTVAKIVYKKASSNYKVCLALGEAKNFILVDEGVDYEKVAKEIKESAFGMSGQRCMAASVVVKIGKDNKIDEYLKESVKGCIEGVDLGPVNSKEAKNNIVNYIEKSKELGSEVIWDGTIIDESKVNKDFLLKPTIIKHTQIVALEDKEVFGPLLEIVEAKDIEEAVALQNASQYGNGSSIYTNDGYNSMYAAEHLTSGMMGINIGVPVPREPYGFGGHKKSRFGNGEITGIESLELFTNRKKVTTKWNLSHKKDWMS